MIRDHFKDSSAHEKDRPRSVGKQKDIQAFKCTPETPCCDRKDQYNGFGSGTIWFKCPKACPCHD